MVAQFFVNTLQGRVHFLGVRVSVNPALCWDLGSDAMTTGSNTLFPLSVISMAVEATTLQLVIHTRYPSSLPMR